VADENTQTEAPHLERWRAWWQGSIPSRWIPEPPVSPNALQMLVFHPGDGSPAVEAIRAEYRALAEKIDKNHVPGKACQDVLEVLGRSMHMAFQALSDGEGWTPDAENPEE
jgi:hypothetical protein